MMDNATKLALKMIKAHNYYYYVGRVPEPQQRAILPYIKDWEKDLRANNEHLFDEYRNIIEMYFENTLRLFYVYDVLLHPEKWKRIEEKKDPKESTMQLRMQECPASMAMLIKYQMEYSREDQIKGSDFRKCINTNKADPSKLLQSMHALIDGQTNQAYISSVIAQAYFKEYLYYMPKYKEVQTEFPNFSRYRDTPDREKKVLPKHIVDFGDVEPQQCE